MATTNDQATPTLKHRAHATNKCSCRVFFTTLATLVLLDEEAKRPLTGFLITETLLWQLSSSEVIAKDPQVSRWLAAQPRTLDSNCPFDKFEVSFRVSAHVPPPLHGRRVTIWPMNPDATKHHGFLMATADKNGQPVFL